jgi:hypothetical protein
MKDLIQPHQDLLFDLLDGKLTTEEAARLRAQIEISPFLKSRYEEVKFVHQMLRSSTLQEPSLNFTKVVMGKLDEVPASAPPSFWKGLFLLAGMLMAIGIAAVLASKGVFDANATINLNDLKIPEQIPQRSLPTFIIDGKMIVNVIIIMNMIIGFIVLDKTILRPIFRRRAMAS